MSIIIPTRINQTTLQWSTDSTVYPAYKILCETNAFYGTTDQCKFKLADGVQTWTQLDYFPVSGYDDATSSIQTQLNGKQASGSYLTAANITQVITDGVTTNAPSEDAVFDALALKQDKVTGVSDTEIGYLDGVTSAIQTQLDSKLSAMDYFNVNNLSVVDLTAYFIGQSTTVGTTVNQLPLVPVKSGTVTRIVCEIFSASTIGSNENGTLEYFYNDGANSTVISNTFKVDANRHAFVEFSGLNISVNAGNTYFVYTAPLLATNPTGIQFRFNVYMK